MKTEEQKQAALNVLLRSLTEMDREIVSTIRSVPDEARYNYAINIWSGVVDRHSKRIAKETEGAVVIKTAKDREIVAAYIYNHVSSHCQRRFMPLNEQDSYYRIR